MGRRWPYFFFLFLTGNRTGTESWRLWAPSPWLAPCVGVTISETPSLYGEMGLRSLLSGPAPRSWLYHQHQGSAAMLCGQISEPGHRQGLGTFPELPDSAPPGMAGPLGYSFASPRARSRTLPSDSLVLSLQVTEAPREQVATAGGGGRSDKGGGQLVLGNRQMSPQGQGTLRSWLPVNPPRPERRMYVTRGDPGQRGGGHHGSGLQG